VIGTGDTMKIIIAPQAFKGSLKAHEAAESMAKGVKSAINNSEIVLLPLADGGEGTVKAMVEATKGRLSVTEVHGPLGEMVKATWGVLGDGKTAIIEMAAASGLNLLPKNSLGAMSASTLGTGELIRTALEAGYRRIIIGLGDSATSDGGAGMARALGIKLLDAQKRPIPPGGEGLSHLEHIDVTGLHPLIRESIIICACDVTNPLYGKEGAAYVYGPQKGATPKMARQLDTGLRKFADIIKRDMGKDISKIPGGGAAGGLAAGLFAFLDASLQSGIDIVCDSIDFDKHLVGADLVLTGEGCIDRQTPRGKTISGIALRAKKAGVPVIAFAGELNEGYEEVYSIGIEKAVSIVPDGMKPEEAMVNAARLLREAVERVIQIYLPGHTKKAI
jgi:glycerate kinase